MSLTSLLRELIDKQAAQEERLHELEEWRRSLESLGAIQPSFDEFERALQQRQLEEDALAAFGVPQRLLECRTVYARKDEVLCSGCGRGTVARNEAVGTPGAPCTVCGVPFSTRE